MKRVGILGGLGPDTTAEFYLDLIRVATTDTRPDIGIESLPLNLQKESEYISSGAHQKYYEEMLLRGARHLESSEAGFIVIPCNTVHEFHSRIASAVSVPVVNLIKVVANEVISRKWSEVILFATSRTLQTQLYQQMLRQSGVEIRVPSENEQARLDILIQGILGNRMSATHQQFLQELVEKSGTTNIVLGCTDLQLVFSEADNVIDSMSALVKHTAKHVI